MEEIVEISLNGPDIGHESTQVDSNLIQENGADKCAIVNVELVEKLKEYESTISNLKAQLINKADVISDLEKQKSSFEKEASHVSCHLNSIKSRPFNLSFSS